MKSARFNMCAGTVTLDLAALKDTIGGAVAQARNELEREQDKIRGEIQAAIHAEFANDPQAHFESLCHANTHREYLVRAAEHYAATIQAYYHVCEAIKRDKVHTVK